MKRKISTETRLRMSLAKRGTTKSPQHRQRIGESLLGRSKSKETRARMAKAQRARRMREQEALGIVFRKPTASEAERRPRAGVEGDRGSTWPGGPNPGVSREEGLYKDGSSAKSTVSGRPEFLFDTEGESGRGSRKKERKG